MRRRCAKMALSCAETNGFVGSDGSLSYSISKSEQRHEEHRGNRWTYERSCELET
jgi:hypothetical protein